MSSASESCTILSAGLSRWTPKHILCYVLHHTGSVVLQIYSFSFILQKNICVVVHSWRHLGSIHYHLLLLLLLLYSCHYIIDQRSSISDQVKTPAMGSLTPSTAWLYITNKWAIYRNKEYWFKGKSISKFSYAIIVTVKE